MVSLISTKRTRSPSLSSIGSALGELLAVEAPDEALHVAGQMKFDLARGRPRIGAAVPSAKIAHRSARAGRCRRARPGFAKPAPRASSRRCRHSASAQSSGFAGRLPSRRLVRPAFRVGCGTAARPHARRRFRDAPSRSMSACRASSSCPSGGMSLPMLWPCHAMPAHPPCAMPMSTMVRSGRGSIGGTARGHAGARRQRAARIAGAVLACAKIV